MSNLIPINNRSRTRIESFSPLNNQRGSAAVDYAVILVFVVLGVIAIIAALQYRSDMIFDATTTVIGDFGSIKEK
jgi:Flp pilus assembly pilin Flp